MTISVVNRLFSVVSWGALRLDVVGLGPGNSMYHQSLEQPRSWQGSWDSRGGIFNSPPKIVSWSPNRLDILAVGTNNGMFHNSWDGSKW